MRDAQVLLSRGAGRCGLVRTSLSDMGRLGTDPRALPNPKARRRESDSRQHDSGPPHLQQARLLDLRRAAHRASFSRESRQLAWRPPQRTCPSPLRRPRQSPRSPRPSPRPRRSHPASESPRPGSRCRLPSWRHTCSRLRRLPIPTGRRRNGSHARIVSPSFAASCSADPRVDQRGDGRLVVGDAIRRSGQRLRRVFGLSHPGLSFRRSERATGSVGDIEEIPQNRGRELQRPPRRLHIDVGCARSHRLKDSDRVLVVRTYRIRHTLVGHVRKPQAPP